MSKTLLGIVKNYEEDQGIQIENKIEVVNALENYMHESGMLADIVHMTATFKEDE